MVWEIVLWEVVRQKGIMEPFLHHGRTEARFQAVPSTGAAGRETHTAVGTKLL